VFIIDFKKGISAIYQYKQDSLHDFDTELTVLNCNVFLIIVNIWIIHTNLKVGTVEFERKLANLECMLSTT